jgi:hypothetical protein
MAQWVISSYERRITCFVVQKPRITHHAKYLSNRGHHTICSKLHAKVTFSSRLPFEQLLKESFEREIPRFWRLAPTHAQTTVSENRGLFIIARHYS